MRNLGLKLFLTLLVSVLIYQNSSADTYPKREMRAAWVTTAWSNDWPTTTGTDASAQAAQKAEAQEYIQKLKAAGFNAVFFQVRGMSDRNYANNSYTHEGVTTTVYEPWTSYISGYGKRGTDPGWDPLQFWIDECHKQGMELHAWINPYRFGNVKVEGANSTLSETYPWSHSNDKAVINNGWVIGHHKAEAESGTSYFILNPALSEVKARITNVCKVLTYNYDIDGIAFDDYFYPEGINNSGTEAQDYPNYQSYVDGGGTMSIENWRRNHINDMISKVYTAIKSIKPFVKFGVAPAGVAYLGLTDTDNCPSIMEYFPNQSSAPSDWQYNGIFSDPIAWMRNKNIDYISPQIYWTTDHATNNFTSLSGWWSEVASIFNLQFYPSHSLDFVNSNNTTTTWSEVAKQVEAMRNTSVDNNLGSIFFASRDLTGKRCEGLAEYLSANTYQNNAITPAINRTEAPNPGAPQNLKQSSGTLTWDAATTTEATVNVGMRYAVYAVPLNTSPTQAKSSIHTNDGGFRSEYLVDLTYSNTADVSDYSSSSYWYAVTIVDRYGNEWEAATINATFESTEISLLSPTSGTSVTDDEITFSWNGTEGASFTLQISKDESFSSILKEITTTDLSATVACDIFSHQTSYYWRVIASKEYYNSTISETRHFISPSLPSFSFSLVSPVNSAVVEGTTIFFEWEAVDDASFTIQISETPTFESNVISQETTAGNYELSIYKLSENTTYYWRVIATRKGYQDYTTQAQEFSTAKRPDEYEPKGDLTIEEIWNQSLLSSKAPYPSQLSGDHRSMTAYNGNVYVVTKTSGQLFEFSGETGEYLRTIYLSGDCFTNKAGTTLGNPTNCIFVDNAGHLCVSNMVTTISTSSQLTVCTVDTSNGYTTRIFQSNIADASMRIDYANAFGDVTADGGQIWAATSGNGTENHNYIYRWTLKNGSWQESHTIATQFHPADAATPGIGGAPWVMPISSDKFIVDGGGNFPTLYTFTASGNATYDSGFDSNTALTPVNSTGAGLGQITLGKTNKYPLFIYSNETHASGGYDFIIAHNPSSFDFSKMEKYWTVPKEKLGDTSHSGVLNSIATIKNDDNSATVFVYAPKNGLAAYRISLPEIPVTLNAPVNDADTKAGFDFLWEGIEGATYTIELSATETFDEIAYSTTTTETILNSTNISLPNSSAYYWRVKASHDDYTTTTSKAARFITPAKPTLCTPVLYMPYDNEELSGDIVFIAIKAYLVNVNSSKLEHADNSILEISRTADFSELIYSNDEWVDVQAGTSEYMCIQHTLPISYFTNGTYYWRVRAQESGYDDAVSEAFTFIVTGQSDTPGTTETDYTLEHEDDPIYPSITETSNNKTTTWQLTNLWIRNSEKNDIGQSATSTNYRGFCARSSQYGDQDGKDILWVACHEGSTTGSLEKYDAATGEYIGSLQLTEKNENLLKSTYPCNDVFVDGAGNLCVMNLKGNSNDLQIAAIDPETGLITHNVTLTVADHRIDHARAIGDITSGEAYVFGTDNNTTVYRWELYNGEVVDMLTNTVTSFYPSKYVSILGTATRIYPIDKTHFYTDGTATAFTLYTFSETGSNATLTSSFNSYDGTDIAPASGNYGNGGTFFMHDGTPFIVYNSSSFASDKADVSYKFNLARVSELTSWGTITKFFGMPKNDNIGTVVNAGNDYGMLADYLQYDALTGSPKGNIATFSNDESFDRTNIYLYVPGNGMAAYSLSRHIDIFTGADGIETSSIKIGYNDEEITFGSEVGSARIFTLSGMQIGVAENSTTIEKPAQKGVYILQLKNINGGVTTHKIVI